MAKVNTGKVTEIRQFQKDCRMITMDVKDISFIGGQYIIVNSGVKLAEDKFAKASYTLCSPISNPESISIIVKKIDKGVCSTHLVEKLKEGDELNFSGPWGAKKFEEFNPNDETLLIATDTGISAIIGLLNSEQTRDCLDKCRILWLTPSENYFIPLNDLKEMIPEQVQGKITVEYVAQPNFSIRIDQSKAILKNILESYKPKFAMLAGDGDIIEPLQQQLYKSGIEENIPVDWFFNNPKKKEEKKDPKNLRTGFTTGACSAAAAKAAAKVLITGKKIESIDTILPNKQEVNFKLERCDFNEDGSATCSIIKDAGDDPDCTDKAELTATVKLLESNEVILIGGKGVATVTQAGLGLEIGTPAINPVPRKNITEMVQLELQASNKFNGAEVTISVPGGKRMAKETMNERLGLVGGISILGTTGIVRPYSTAAFRASIVQAINLAMHLNYDEVVFTTGGKSEQYAMEIHHHLKVESFIQVGDFIGSSLKSAKKAGIRQINIVGMMGKLSKMADGQTQTHMKGSSVNIPMLAAITSGLGASEEVKAEILKANTARHVLEICSANNLENITEELCKRVVQVMTDFVGGGMDIHCYLVDFGGKLLASVKGID